MMTKQTLFVVKGLHQNLLGLPAITSLHLLHRVRGMVSVDDLQSQFPGIFSGLGTLGEEYHIQLKMEQNYTPNLQLGELPFP